MSAWTGRSSDGKAEAQIVPPCLRIPWWKGLGADSEEKREPLRDIDTAVADSLKALDPEWPIREADIHEFTAKPDVPLRHFADCCSAPKETDAKADRILNMEHVMSETNALAVARLKTPKAAAIAGIVFSVLLITIFWLLRRSVPADPLDSGTWLATESKTVALAMNLVPFAGVAFLWFIGVLRDRLGQQEDRFFATVFFGSALLFLAMLFASAAITGAIILVASSTNPNELSNSATFRYARATGYIFMNVYAIKMAGVFMISTSTVVIYTEIAPRWIAVLGYVLAVILLIGSYYINLSFFVLPLWVLLVSIYILLDNLRRPQQAV